MTSTRPTRVAQEEMLRGPEGLQMLRVLNPGNVGRLLLDLETAG